MRWLALRRGVLAFGLLLSQAAAAAAIVYSVIPTDEDLVGKSPVIVFGEVLSSRPVGTDGLFTDFVLRIEENLKGLAGSTTIVVRQPGGETADGLFTDIGGLRRFVPGDRVLLFLEPADDAWRPDGVGLSDDPRGRRDAVFDGFDAVEPGRVPEDAAPSTAWRTVDLGLGTFFEESIGGRTLLLREPGLDAPAPLGEPDARAADANSHGEHRPEARNAGAFRRWIVDRVADLERPADYRETVPDEGPMNVRQAFGVDTYTHGICTGALIVWDDPLVLKIETHTAPPRTPRSKLRGDGYQDAVNALAAWIDDPGSNVRLSIDRKRQTTRGAFRDGVSSIRYSGLSHSNVLAWTTRRWACLGNSATGEWRGRFLEADISFNRSNDALHWARNLFFPDAKLERVLGHEIGHVLGLNHSQDTAAMMYVTVVGDGSYSVLHRDDQRGIGFLYPGPAREGSTAKVSIATMRPFGKDVTFNIAYGAAGDTATGAANPADGDYDNDAVTSVTFGGNDTSKTISIPISDDNEEEGDETFTVTFTPTAPLPAGLPVIGATRTVTIADGDGPLGVTVTPTALTIDEGSSGSYTVKLNAPPSGKVKVRVSGASGDVSVSGSPLTFTNRNWIKARTVTVNAAADDDATADATVTLNHAASGGGYNSVTIDPVVVTVKETTSFLQLSATALTINEGSSGSYTVKLNAAPANDVTVTVSGASGDVSVSGSPLTFTPRNYGTAQTVTVNAARDADATDDTATLTHSVSGDGHNGVTTNSVKVTVTDTTPALQLSTDPDTVTEGAAIRLWVLSDKYVQGKLAVSLTLADRGSSGFGAADIPGGLGPRTFDANFSRLGYPDSFSTRGWVSIPTNKDTEAESAETYRITLNDTADYELGADKTADGTLNDGGGAVSIPQTLVSIPSTLTVAEGVGSATVRIVTPSAFGAATTFNVSYGSTSVTTDEDATGAADPSDGDYDNDAVTSVTFGASDTTKDISIPITDDDLDESDETFTVTIAPASSLPDGFGLGNAATTVTITDDDASPVLAAIDDVTLRVGQTVDVTASATDADNDAISYVWSRKAGETTPAIPGGTNLNQAQLTFVTTAAGTVTMTVTASDGNGNEAAEEVVITVQPALSVTVTPTALTVEEDSSNTYTVQLDAEPSGNVTVTVSRASGDVTVTGSPLTFTDQNYGTAQTVTVSATKDEDATDDIATLTHSATGGDYNGVTIADVDVTVTDVTPVLQLTTDPSTVTEGTPISLTVTSDKELTGTLAVILTLADRGSSGFGAADVPGGLGPRTFDAAFGATPSRTGTVSIPTTADSAAKGAETYRITLNDTAAYELGADTTADGTLNDGSDGDNSGDNNDDGDGGSPPGGGGGGPPSGGGGGGGPPPGGGAGGGPGGGGAGGGSGGGGAGGGGPGGGSDGGAGDSGGDADDGGNGDGGGSGSGGGPGGGGALSASFTLDTPCADGLCRARTGVAVSFDDTSSGPVSSRRWNFGDGGTSRGRSPEHTWSVPGFYTVSLTVSSQGDSDTESRKLLVESAAPAGTCVSDAETLCLRDSRFSVALEWWTADGQRGVGSVVHEGTNDSGLFWFFGAANWELLIKVLDGCSVNGHVWVYGASATTLGYSLTVTDTVTGAVRAYRNEPGEQAPAFTDSKAFPDSCRP